MCPILACSRYYVEYNIELILILLFVDDGGHRIEIR